LYALQLACQSLNDGSCDGAVVIGTNLIFAVEEFMGMAKLGVLSPTGRCHTFDISADGYARAEGVTAIFVKKATDAYEGRNPVRALIRGYAFNS
jgi:acyl transferase domain-containing protein